MNKIILSSFIMAMVLLSSCTPTIIGTAATATGKTLIQEKSFGTDVNDKVIWTKIKNSMFRTDVNELFGNVTVTVNEGRVLLTGKVTKQETRIDAVRIAWNQQGVKEVINEIDVVEFEDNPGKTIKTYGTDSWVTTQIKSKMLFNQDIRSINYEIETIDGTVYLIGIARSQDELNLVNDIAKNTGFVKKVINYVRLKDSELRGENSPSHTIDD
jgi:osmotically-inducible protein OsmY